MKASAFLDNAHSCVGGDVDVQQPVGQRFWAGSTAASHQLLASAQNNYRTMDSQPQVKPKSRATQQEAQHSNQSA